MNQISGYDSMEARAARIIARVAGGDISNMGGSDFQVLAKLARRMATSGTRTVTHVQVLILQLLAAAPTVEDRTDIAHYLQSPTGRQTLANILANARRELEHLTD